MDLREKFKQRLNAPPPDPKEAAARFLRIYCSDADSIAETREHIARVTSFNRSSALEGLSAIETLLSTPQEEGFLSMLVAMEGNKQLEDPSDLGAARWLRTIGEMIREVLRNVQHPHSGR